MLPCKKRREGWRLGFHPSSRHRLNLLRHLRPEIDGSPSPLLAALVVGGAGTSDLRFALYKVPKIRDWSTSSDGMVAMVALRGTRIRYSRLLVHLVDGDFAGGVEDGEKSSGRCSRGVVDLGQPTRVTGCLYVIFIMFGCFVLLVNFRSRSFSQKKKTHTFRCISSAWL